VIRPRVTVTAIVTVGLGLGLAPVASAYEYGPVYSTCTVAHDAGVYDIPQGDSAYWDDGDRDNDGYACDSPGN
jgi:hypothetical protein